MYITQKELIEKYGFTRGLIDKYLKNPGHKKKPNGKNVVCVYDMEEVKKLLEDKQIKKFLSKRLAKKQKRENKRIAEKQKLVSFLELFDIERYRRAAEEMDRRFILHVGPTNSGKTYSALKELKYARSGMYLGPLRLLALEMYDRLNQEGYPTSLLTGEERIETEGALYTASTIELCDYDNEYDCVIIDEAQMISDPYRGDKWTKAIYMVNAKEIHICLAPEALFLIEDILDSFNAEYQVVNHERLAPLQYSGKIKSLDQVQKGDCLVCFSRRAVLATAAELSKINKKASVIYGALPPESRREEVRRFSSGETNIIVSTDAIGMGISLPIRRVIFMECEKYDGNETRPLTVSEVKQIAGRAGRYGIYDLGEVLTMAPSSIVKHALEEETPLLESISIPFPLDSLDSEYSLEKLFDEWQALEKVPGFEREDLSDAIVLLKLIKKNGIHFEKRMLYDMVTCPVDIKSDQLLQYYIYCLQMIEQNLIPEKPSFTLETLEGCELQYKAFDVRHQLLRRIGVDDDDQMADKNYISSLINVLLIKNQKMKVRRCKECGRVLPEGFRFKVCDRCFRETRRYR